MAKKSTTQQLRLEGYIYSQTDGKGNIVTQDGQKFLCNKAQMHQVLDGDIVRLKMTTQSHQATKVEIDTLIARTHPAFTAILKRENSHTYAVRGFESNYQHVFMLESEEAFADGTLVCVEVLAAGLLEKRPQVKLIEVLGKPEDSGVEIELALRYFQLPWKFSEATQKECMAMSTKLKASDLRERKDLTQLAFVTIDGEDARDFDDAVYCENQGNTWRLWVAIADVSHYVKSGSALDLDALARTTSVYFPRRVIPMLPEKLSNELCSLVPLQKRLALTCEISIDVKGNIIHYDFYQCVFESRARLTYNQVAQWLQQKDTCSQPAIMPHLQNLYQVFLFLMRARERRGALELEIAETQMHCNAAGKIVSIEKRQRNDAHRMIEECMLAANVCAADFLHHHQQALLYRIHEKPSAERLEALNQLLATFNVPKRVNEKSTTKHYQAIAASVMQNAYCEQIHTALLRSMKQAQYLPHNKGHFGLAYQAYAHFTSPIRRYPDLLVHRAIKAVLKNKRYQPSSTLLSSVTLLSAAHHAKVSSASTNPTNWEKLGIHCSAGERRADEASLFVERWLKCWYMRDKVGEVMEGKISAVMPFGIFVELAEVFVDGLVHISALGNDYFYYDARKLALIGERTAIRFSLGTTLKVQVARVDMDTRRIDLRLVQDVDTEKQSKRSQRNTHKSKKLQPLVRM